MRYYLGAFAIAVIGFAPWLNVNNPSALSTFVSVFKEGVSQVASVILSHKFKSVDQIVSNYKNANSGNTKVRILIVPGHEPDFGGTEFGLLKEREMTVELAQNLQNLLQNNDHYQVFVTRDNYGWSANFSEYFKNNWESIVAWQKASHDEFRNLISVGSKGKPKTTVYHNPAPVKVALRLYGITKWANENNIDIVIHVHFNDYPRSRTDMAGDYSGFAIYVPASQYGNSTTTKTIADTIFRRLSKYNPVSDLKGESRGIVDESELIAIGANNTSDAASMLIEYGYIYERQFADPVVRSLALKDLAFQTYLGIQDFFGSGNDVNFAYDTLMMPRTFERAINHNSDPSEVFALQTAFLLDGLYPPSSRDMNDCPRSGSFGPCTKSALKIFQDKYDITGENGVVGPKTLEKLNSLYGVRAI